MSEKPLSKNHKTNQNHIKLSDATTYPMKKGVKPTIQNSNPINLSQVN